MCVGICIVFVNKLNKTLTVPQGTNPAYRALQTMTLTVRHEQLLYMCKQMHVASNLTLLYFSVDLEQPQGKLAHVSNVAHGALVFASIDCEVCVNVCSVPYDICMFQYAQ